MRTYVRSQGEEAFAVANGLVFGILAWEKDDMRFAIVCVRIVCFKLDG
jgi:hypothetical protein